MSEFDIIFSKRDKLQDSNNIHIKLKVHDFHKKAEKTSTDFEPVIDEDVKKQVSSGWEIQKKDGHISCIGNDYSEIKLQYNKRSFEEVLVQRAVKTTIQTL